AGTSYVMGQYCQALAPAVWERFALEGPAFQGGALWSNHPGPPLSQWPAPPGGANAGGSDQNANTVVSDTTGAGGFTAVEVGFALERNFPVASVRNDAGVFVQPTTAAVNKALSHAGGAVGGVPTLRFNPGDQDAYNPSAYNYALVRTGVNGMTPDKGSVLAQFLNYAVTRGQLKAEGLGYVPLPQRLIDGARDGIATVNGAPPRPQFNYADAMPPTSTTGPTTTGASTTSPSVPPTAIKVAGSALMAPLVQSWTTQLAASPSSTQISYIRRNARSARQALLGGQVDAALSAVPFDPADLVTIAALTAAGQQPEFVTIPISASALLFAELTPKNALHPPDSLTPTFDVPPGPAAGYTTAQALRFYMERPTLYDPEFAALHGYQVYDPGPGGEEPPRPNDVLPSDFAQLEISARVGPSAMGWMMERMMKERAPELWQRYRARIGRPTDSLSEDIVIPYSFNGSEPARWNTMSYERNLEEILAFATTGARPCCFFAGLPPWAMQQYRFRALDLLGLNRADQANLDRWELRPLRIDGVLPTPETIAAALASGDGLSSTAATLPDMGGGYPASFVNKMIVRTDTLTPERVNSMVELIVFLVTTGQDQAPPLGDPRLPRFHVLGALDAANQLVSKACPQQQIVPGVTVELPPGAGTQGATVVMWGCRVAAMPPDPIIPESPWVLAIPLSAAASLAAVAAFRSKRGRASLGR
ncbi:MAG: hypothetical protein ACKV2O_09165, partial [Acidimicrobiales bacterium]